MTKQELIDLLNNDLKNEWKHHNFYLHNASTLTGLLSIEYKEFLLKQAAGEMHHVTQFSDMIIGLGGVPTKVSNDFPTLSNLGEILNYAVDMEEEVLSNYVQRIQDAEKLGGVDGYWVTIFLENQIQDSRQDRDEIIKFLS
jgi:bacterioferritin (cytochrome b1)